MATGNTTVIDRFIHSRRAMQCLLGAEYAEQVERFKVFLLAQMSQSRCDELMAVGRLLRRLAKADRLSGLTVPMLEAAAVELIAQSPCLCDPEAAQRRRRSSARSAKRLVSRTELLMVPRSQRYS